eukprot:gene37354-50407_t
MGRFFAVMAVVAIVLYVAAGIALYSLQRSLIFIGDRTDLDPAEAGVPAAKVHRLKTDDGVDLTAWVLDGRGPYVIIYFHGNGAALSGRADRIEQLAGLGPSVLAIDYRGYGGSSGAPSEQGLKRDADAAYAFAVKLGFAADHVILYGESLGTGVAVDLAARRPVAGVILDAPFSALVDVAADRYWMFPVRWLLKDTFRSDRVVSKITAPILILHGRDDSVVPLRYGQRLSHLAGDRSSFVVVEDGGHVVLGTLQGFAQARDWLRRHFADLTRSSGTR